MNNSEIVCKPSKHYSPLRYPGGKASLATFLGRLISLNRIENCVYVEPYAGGAGAALNLLMLEQVDSIVINDFDSCIHAFWNSVLNDTRSFIDRLMGVDITINEWEHQREIYRDIEASSFDRGFATFYLNRANRSGIITGGPIGGHRQESKWKVDARFNKVELVKRIQRIARYRERIKLYNMDGVDLLAQLLPEKNVLAYIDPPYVVKGAALYLNHYKEEDHSTLANYLNSNSNLNWVLTYDNTELVVNLYKHRSMTEFNLTYHASAARKGHELMVLSDTLKVY